MEAEVDLSMFDLSKKKKKKKKKTKTEGEDEEGGAAGDDREEGEGRYNYETLLERIQVSAPSRRWRCCSSLTPPSHHLSSDSSNVFLFSCARPAR